LFAGQTISLVGKYTQEMSGTIAVSGQVGNRNVRYEVPMSLPSAESSNQSIAYLWARQRIHELGKILWTADPAKKAELVAKIKEISMQFRLMSDYTAFVAVDESRIIGDGKPLKVLQPVPTPAGVNTEQGVSAAKVSSWGILFTPTKDGRLKVTDVDTSGIAARSGIKTGSVLESVNHVMIRDLAQLETILLQAGADTIQLSFEKQGNIVMPRP
jgi:hypothetical protein